jgi:hypothetical protein
MRSATPAFARSFGYTCPAPHSPLQHLLSMPLLAEYNLDQLNRLLTFSKWILLVCGVILVVLAIINQWVAARISSLQQEEKTRAQQQLRASRAELSRTKSKTDELTSELSRFVAPRSLANDQIEALKKCLADGPKGKVIMASLKTETDAEPYAIQIAEILIDAGFDVTTSKTVWLQLPVKGLYLCAPDVANAPIHAVHIQRCFQTVGLRLRAHEDKKMYSDMDVPENAIIFVIGARE